MVFSQSNDEFKSLTTTLFNDNIAQGNYWDIVAFNDITIVALEFNTNGCAGTYVTRLWKRINTGGFSGFENTQSEWELVTQEDVGCNVTAPNSILRDFQVEILAGDTQAFFLYIEQIDSTDTTVSLNQGDEGSPLVANTDLAVLIGTIVEPGDPEFQRTNDPSGQQPNLVIIYVEGTLSPTLAPTRPTRSPTLRTVTPTKNPTRFGQLPTRFPGQPTRFPGQPTFNGGGKGGKGKGGNVKRRRRRKKGGNGNNNKRQRNGGVIPFGKPRGSGNSHGISKGNDEDRSTFRDNFHKLTDFIYNYAFTGHNNRNYDAIYGNAYDDYNFYE